MSLNKTTVKHIPFLIFFSLIALCSFGQSARTIIGTVKDTSGVAIPGSTVKLVAGTDSVTTMTNPAGAFSFANIKAAAFRIEVSSIGYRGIQKRYTNAESILGVFTLRSEATQLNAVVVESVTLIKLKGDTTEFNANAYKVREGAPVEDMLKKLPGFDVDKSGNVTAQGKSVTKVRVNGKDFFIGDLKTATQN